ncbi:hypothetical protein Rsub_12504 [Raphidocelis subcapitata]|uniref:Uncharacterized protein n=1 Tax=Raphidocelis subcapitata TaxID=307507 RepID=A0A2V0PJ81_9CHLO|nr:hypothetical protein Rsub_12504 [Raphidocelis subcapitata]|eukprot:GBF99864.1 hypothetical protein Rsub_12504 [Raphidocelis subcapitata]
MARARAPALACRTLLLLALACAGAAARSVKCHGTCGDVRAPRPAPWAVGAAGGTEFGAKTPAPAASALSGTDAMSEFGYHAASLFVTWPQPAAGAGPSDVARLPSSALDAAADAATADVSTAGYPPPPQPSHKPLWPLSSRDLLLFALTAATLVLAAGGGIGGGAIYMPLLAVLGGFTASEAVALSNLTILGGAVANLTLNARRPHPRAPGRPLIDWSLILIMEPTTILGALLGSYANKLLPSVVTVTLLTALLTLLTAQLLRRAGHMFRAETRQRLAEAEATDDSEAEAEALEVLREESRLLVLEPLLHNSESSEGSEGPADGHEDGGAGHEGAERRGSDAGLRQPLLSGRRDQSLSSSARARAAKAPAGPRAAPPLVAGAAPPAPEAAEEAPASGKPAVVRGFHLPFWPVFALVLLTGAVAASDLAKARVRCGSPAYWAVVLSVVPPAFATTLLCRRHLLRHDAAAGDNLKYTPRNTLLYPAVCSLAGVVAGLFGLGGGVVKAPLMLELGVLPDVAAATSTTMIAFTSMAACVVYANFGLIPTDYGAFLFCLGLVGSAAGQLATAQVVRALKRRSVIVFTMATLMMLSSGTAVWNAAGRWVDVASGDRTALEWGNICTDESR